MNDEPGGFIKRARKAVQVTAGDLTEEQPLSAKHAKGIMLRAMIPGMSAEEWGRSNRGRFENLLEKNGAVLLRGFTVQGAEDFRAFVQGCSGPLLDYSYRSTPRSAIVDGVFTSTDYPADQSIPQHNEMSYSLSWPRRLFFFCAVAPSNRGQTPIADGARVYSRIPEPIRERFERHGVRYIRNYGKRFDLPWQQVFQTADPKAVEDYCMEHKIEWEWRVGGILRTCQTCQASICHPKTGERLWFNQAHLFHISGLPDEVRKEMEMGFSPLDLPRNAFFGDGSEIPVEDLEAIRTIYQEEEIIFDWSERDILAVDNIAMSHGRASYSPPRKIMVAMT